MDWLAAVDGYCERTGPQYWAEPLNALTNLAFLLAAAVMWRRAGPSATGHVLCGLLAAIGVGSWLFHTHANRLAGMLDVLPIGLFILAYLFVASRDFLRLPVWGAGLAAAGFVPWAMVITPLFAALPGFRVSAMYWPVPVLIAVYAALLARRAPDTARGLAIGAGLLCVSLGFRSVDMTVCPAWPSGTHFLWHLTNALMLGWMIEVWRRHRDANVSR